jgi:hypothetical protein
LIDVIDSKRIKGPCKGPKSFCRIGCGDRPRRNSRDRTEMVLPQPY